MTEVDYIDVVGAQSVLEVAEVVAAVLGARMEMGGEPGRIVVTGTPDPDLRVVIGLAINDRGLPRKVDQANHHHPRSQWRRTPPLGAASTPCHHRTPRLDTHRDPRRPTEPTLPTPIEHPGEMTRSAERHTPESRHCPSCAPGSKAGYWTAP